MHVRVLGPGRMAGGVLSSVGVWAPHEVGSLLGSEPVSPSPSACLSPPFPGDNVLTRLSGQQGPARLPALSLDVQAHWRGYRQRKVYRERLQYLEANTGAIIKVALPIWAGSCLVKDPLRTVFESSRQRVTSGAG